MRIHLFGASTPSGEAFRQLCEFDLVGHSQKESSCSWIQHADLNQPNDFYPAGSSNAPAIWISFAPIWLMAPFLEYLFNHHPERLQGLRGIIACSSSSTITKRFLSTALIVSWLLT